MYFLVFDVLTVVYFLTATLWLGSWLDRRTLAEAHGRAGVAAAADTAVVVAGPNAERLEPL